MKTLTRKAAQSAAAAICTFVLASAGVTTASDAAVVPNMYHCSIQTQQCWQTNPPHVASIINKCYWYTDDVYNAAWASTTCDKYTPR